MTDLATIGFKADTTQLVTAEKRLDSLAKHGDKTEKSIDGMNKALGAAGAVIATLGLTRATQEVIQYADSWTMVTNQLRQVTSGTEDLFLTQQKVVDLAKETRTNLEATTDLYAGLSRSTQSLGKTQEDVLAVTGTLNKLFLVGGKSAEEAAGAIRQLNQGLEAGALRGDEFNSVAEGAPRILDALSNSLNIARGDLKTFAATGGITAEILFKALKDYETTADRMASKVQATYAQSLEVAKTNVTQFVGESEILKESTMALGNAFVFASENIEPIIAGLGAAGAVLVASTIPSMVSYTASLAAATAGTSALTLATRVLLGPIGLTVAALGAAATAFSVYKDDIDEASKAAEDHAKSLSKIEKSAQSLIELEKDKKSKEFTKSYIETQKEAAKVQQDLIDSEIELKRLRESTPTRELMNLKQFTDAIEKAKDAVDKNKKSLKEKNDTLDALNNALDGNIQSLQGWKEAGSEVVKVTKEMSAAQKQMADGFNSQILSIKNQKEELSLTTDEFEEYQAVQEAIAYGAGPEMIKVIKEQIKELQKQRKELALFSGFEEISAVPAEFAKAGEAAIDWARVTDRAIDSVDAAFVDVIMNIDQGFDGLFDNLENAFKRMVAEMIYQAAKADIAGALSGGGSGFSNLSALGGGNQVGSAISGAGGIFSGAGGVSNNQFAMAAALGGLFGGTAGGNGDVGGSIGAAIGMAAGGPIGAAVGAVLGGAVGSLFGGKYELAEQRVTVEIMGDDFEGEVTSTEKKKKLWKNRYRTTVDTIEDGVLDDLFSSLQDSIINAAEILDVDEVTKTTYEYERVFDDVGDGIARNFEAIAKTTTMSVEDWLDSFSSSLDFDSKGLSQEEIQAKITEWADRTSNAMISGVFGSVLSDLQKEGESSSEAMQRVISSIELFESTSSSLGLTFDETKASVAEVASSIVDMSGGLQNFAALSNSYYQNFFSEEERRLNSTQQLTDAFSELGLALPESRDAFRDIIDGIDLTTEAGQQLYTSLLALNPALAQLIDSTARAAEEAERAAEREAELKAREAEALANKELDLRIQLLQLHGSEEEALSLIRQRQLENLDPSLRALMQEIYAEQDLTKARDEAAAAAQQAKDAEINRLNELFDTLTNNVAFAKSEVEKSRDAEIERISLLEKKNNEKYKLEIDSINQAAKARKSAISAEQKMIKDQLSIVSAVSRSLGAASSGFTSEQALQAARRGDFSLAQNINENNGSFGSATDESIARAMEAFNLAEIGKLADAQKDSLQSELNFAEMQISAIELASQKEIEAAKAQLELDKKEYAEQKEQINKQINELLGIDTSVMSLEAATALYNKEQQALLELDYENQIAALQQSEIQTEIQREQVSQLEAVNASLIAIIDDSNRRGEIIISPPWIEESTQNNNELVAELRKMREDLNNANMQIAQNTAKTAKSTRNIEYQNEGQL